MWFSLVGGWLLRRLKQRQADAITICHNDALGGDVYVNHGVLKAAMKARGNYAKRILRNPLHLFVLARDAVRYRGSMHKVVVALTEDEKITLLRTYPRLQSKVVVIPNGVDIDRFSATFDTGARVRTRSELGLGPADHAVLFVGHEFERKGLLELMTAIVDCPADVVVVVVGGSPDMLVAARRESEELGIADRVRFVGQVADPRPYFAASDVFCLPSAYEANALVILEALAMGLPVVATRVGFASDIIVDGVNGMLVERTAADVCRGLMSIVGHAEQSWPERARATALEHSWSKVALDYVDLAATLSA
jgi:UDP-glucose:(heptosyl)LPS alpha-1,3-glucosyltransferase